MVDDHVSDSAEEHTWTNVFDVRPFVTWLCVSFVALSSSCYAPSTGEDSWEHYVSGGMFTSAAPSLSPNGECLVYATPCTGHGDIYIIQSGAGTSIRLTNSEDFEASPMFTPDGHRVVFSREHEHRRHLWIMESDGSDARQITHGNYLDDPLYLSRDGRYLLFGRTRPSGGSGRVLHTYLLCIDEPSHNLISVGEVAVLSPDSKFVVYSDRTELWRLGLDGKDITRHRIRSTGWPLDITQDGRLILVARRPEGQPWTGDDEIWVFDTVSESERRLALGHSAFFFGENSKNVLFLAGQGQTLYVTTTDGAEPRRIASLGVHKTHPRVCWDGNGAISGSFARSGAPDFDVMFIDFDNLQLTTIATIRCDGASFQTPRERIERNKGERNKGTGVVSHE